VNQYINGVHADNNSGVLTGLRALIFSLQLNKKKKDSFLVSIDRNGGKSQEEET
jgi:hypothetical protein